MSFDLSKAAEIVEGYGCKQSNLIAILQDIQTEYNYLSEEVLCLVAEKLGVSTSKVYSVATFYENFSLEPKGSSLSPSFYEMMGRGPMIPARTVNCIRGGEC